MPDTVGNRHHAYFIGRSAEHPKAVDNDNSQTSPLSFQVLKAIDAEIRWCEEYFDSSNEPSAAYKAAFIKGLKQARYLVTEIR